MISAKVICDSVAPCGARLVTAIGVYPLIIHNEVMTHKMLSKSAASSRAIPVAKMIKRVVNDPFTPCYIGANQKGMIPGQELTDELRSGAVSDWEEARSHMVTIADRMSGRGVHKGVVNRLLNPFQWMTVILSGTELDNFFGLRDHSAAEPHLQEFANLLKKAVNESKPRLLQAGEWHRPLLLDDDYSLALEAVIRESDSGEVKQKVQERLTKVSVGRCARVSYLTHDGVRDQSEDVRLHDQLLANVPLHASPAEHVGRALDMPSWYMRVGYPESNVKDLRNAVVRARNARTEGSTKEPQPQELFNEAALGELQSGNFYGFKQYRKMLANENIGSLMP